MNLPAGINLWIWCIFVFQLSMIHVKIGLFLFCVEIYSSLQHQIIRMKPSKAPVGQLYNRLVPLILLLVDGNIFDPLKSFFPHFKSWILEIWHDITGGSPIDISDSSWDIYFVIEKTTVRCGDVDATLLGFATLYRFYHYPSSTRFRISQVHNLFYQAVLCFNPSNN